MGVRKVSNSERDNQGHSRSPVMVPFYRPYDILLVSHCNSVSILTVSETFISQNLNQIKSNQKQIYIEPYVASESEAHGGDD